MNNNDTKTATWIDMSVMVIVLQQTIFFFLKHQTRDQHEN
jgi:hypothetical protein